jgi:multicomponent K+:H+ antiporter subunit D
MSHWVVGPLVLALAGAVCALLLERLAPRWVAPFGLLLTALGTVLALALVQRAESGVIEPYLLGNWPAPFGIVLVLDRLSALMLLLTWTLALFALAYAVRYGQDRGRHFHALFQVQLLGLAGAFLTADLFNLFVWFEVLLLASYGLLTTTGTPAQIKRSIHYVSLNLVGSALFLVAVAILYGTLGSLNLADLAQRVAAAPDKDLGLIRIASLLLLVVFCLKAALLPLNFWLPQTYGVAAAPVAALFAIMTKVGVYAVLRIYTQVFGAEAGAAGGLAPWVLLPFGIATVLYAAYSALAQRQLRPAIGALVVLSAGTLIVALSFASAASLSAALYYLVHSSLVTAGMFLLADRIVAGRAAYGDDLSTADAPRLPTGLALSFLILAVAAAGLPPLSGFLGKLLILGAIPLEHPLGGWAWGVILFAGLLVIVALARAGSALFWRPRERVSADAPRSSRAVLGLIAVLLLLTLFAAPVERYTRATAEQVLSPSAYREALFATQPAVRVDGRPPGGKLP